VIGERGGGVVTSAVFQGEPSPLLRRGEVALQPSAERQSRRGPGRERMFECVVHRHQGFDPVEDLQPK
jgi:hypothetical protein